MLLMGHKGLSRIESPKVRASCKPGRGLSADVRHDLLGKALKLANLVRTTEPHDNRLCTRCHEILDPRDTGIRRAKAYAWPLGHDVKWRVIIAFDKGTHVLLGLGDVVIDRKGGVDGPV